MKEEVLHINYNDSVNFNITNKSKLEIFKIRLRIVLALKNVELTDWSVNVLYWFIFFTQSEKKYKNFAGIEKDIAAQLKRKKEYVRAYFSSVLIKKNLVQKIKDKSNRVQYFIEPWVLQLYFCQDINFSINLNYTNFDK